MKDPFVYNVKVTTAIQASKLHLVNLLTGLRKSFFVKNVFIVMSGTAAAQAIGFALTPIISRLFSPSDFGVFGSFDAVLTVIAAGVTLDYSQAIMLPKEKEDAINLFTLSCVSTALISTLCLAICLLVPSYLQDLMKIPNAWMLVLLVVAILISGLNQSCQAWCVRVKAFKDTSASQVIRSLSSSGMQIGFGYLKGGPTGLIFSSILADMFASLNLVRVVFRDLIVLRRDIRWARMKQLTKEYRDFPMYSASQNVINALSLGLPVLLLSHYYGIIVAGAYAFSERILSAPMGFVLRPLRQVLFQKAAETQNLGGRLVPLYVKITSGLFALAFFPSLVLFIWAPLLFTWIFGSQWHTAGEFAQSLVLWMMFMFCNLPSVLFARIIRMQRYHFLFSIVSLTARSLVLFFGGMYLSASHTIMLFAVVGAIMNMIFIVIVGYALMRKEGDASLKGIFNSMKEDTQSAL
jgi:lipopolysaccharide exporter